MNTGSIVLMACYLVTIANLILQVRQCRRIASQRDKAIALGQTLSDQNEAILKENKTILDVNERLLVVIDGYERLHKGST